MLQKIGLTLITIGFLVGCLFAVVDYYTVDESAAGALAKLGYDATQTAEIIQHLAAVQKVQGAPHLSPEHAAAAKGLLRTSVEWSKFGPGFLLGLIGVVLVQVARRKAATAAETLTSNIKELETSLANIVTKMTALDDGKEDIDVYDLPDRIDETFPDDINTFVEARESMIHVYGVQTYAEIMGDFAAGERYLNRVWSAAAEGYIDEAHTYIARSRAQFDLAQGKLQGAAG